MWKFTIRDLLWLIVVVALSVGLIIERQSRRADQRALARSISEDEREWLTSRFEAAKAEYQARMQYWRGSHTGRMILDDACSAIERFAQAAEDLPADPQIRVKELADALESARFLESITHEKFIHEIEPLTALKRTQYALAEVQVRLKRVEREIVVDRMRR
jgi:hypothetical protein